MEKPRRSFFDDYPLFYDTGHHPARHGGRHDCLIRDRRELIEGRRIIDLGSHDGRWSFAALKAGAADVTGLEARPQLVELANRNFVEYGIDHTRYRFLCGDALKILARENLRADTVFLFGVFYHIQRHIDWAKEIARTGANAVIIDTHQARGLGPDDSVVRYGVEPIDKIVNASDEIRPGAKVALTGIPSRGFILLLFRELGYALTEIDWGPYLAEWGTKTLDDYADGRRTTFVTTRCS